MTGKQKDFCKYYAMYKNATLAALKAGYSKKTSYSIGCDLLKLPEIATEIQKLKLESYKANGITIERLKEELAAIAFSDIRDIVTWGTDGKKKFITDIKHSDSVDTRAIKKFSVDSRGKVTFEWHDKLAAIREIMQDLRDNQDIDKFPYTKKQIEEAKKILEDLDND